MRLVSQLGGKRYKTSRHPWELRFWSGGKENNPACLIFKFQPWVDVLIFRRNLCMYFQLSAYLDNWDYKIILSKPHFYLKCWKCFCHIWNQKTKLHWMLYTKVSFQMCICCWCVWWKYRSTSKQHLTEDENDDSQTGVNKASKGGIIYGDYLQVNYTLAHAY